MTGFSVIPFRSVNPGGIGSSLTGECRSIDMVSVAIKLYVILQVDPGINEVPNWCISLGCARFLA